MILDLNPLPFNVAINIIKWCFEHNIDRAKCIQLIEAMSKKPVDNDIEWVLNIPEKYITWFVLKWGNSYAVN